MTDKVETINYSSMIENPEGNLKIEPDMNDNTETLKFFEDDFELERKNLNCCERYFSPIRGGSLRSSIITFASICFGTCGLSLPVAMTNVGLIPGTMMFIGLTLICYWSLYILLLAGRAKKVLNYSKLVELLLGSKMAFILDISNWIFCFGVLMVYQFVISSFSMEVLNVWFGFDIDDQKIKFLQMFGMMLFIQIPLGMLKNMSKLQYTGMVGLFVFFYITCVIFIESFFYFKEGREEGREIKYFSEINFSIFDSFSIFLYCYAAHNGMFPIYSELKDPTKRRSFSVMNRAVLIQFITFCIILYSGFFSLIKETPSIFILRPDLQILEGFDYFMFIAKVIYIFSLNCSSAFVFNLIRTSVKSIFSIDRDLPLIYDLALNITVYVVSNTLCFYISNVVQIIGVIVGLCGVMMSFVLPILCYVEANGLPKTHPKNLGCLFLLLVISFMGICSSTKSLLSIFDYRF